MKGKMLIRRAAALLLTCVMAQALCAAAAAEEKAPGKLNSVWDSEFIVPSTFPPGYYSTAMEEGAWLRDAADTKIDGKWQTKLETPLVLEIERVSGDLAEEDVEGFLTITEDKEHVCLEPERLKAAGTAVWNIHIETEHYVLDYEYSLLARPFDEEKDALPHDRLVIETEENRDAETVLSEYLSGLEKKFTAYSVSSQLIGSKTSEYYHFRVRNHKMHYGRWVPVTFLVHPKGGRKPGEPVTVSSFAELLDAVNNRDADRILISAKYKHGKNVNDEALEVRGDRTVTISPEEGRDSAVINGRIEIRGNGRVVFDRVDIEAPQGEVGLWVTGGADVTAISVKGGDSTKENGGTAAYVRDSTLTAERLLGGSSKAGLAGDGVLAAGTAVVTVAETAGGSSNQGIGGYGAIAVAGAQVTVTGRAVGGSAPIPGRGWLAGAGSVVNLQGEAADGETVEVKKKPNPEVITSYALLQNAIRNGETDITLDGKFAFGQAVRPLPLFAPGDETVRIRGPEGKPLKIKDGLFDFCCGRWEVSGIDLNSKSAFTALNCDGKGTEVTWNGNLAVSNGNAVVVSDHAKLTLNGNVDHSSKTAVAVGTISGARLWMTGNITEKDDRNAVYADDTEIVLTGNVSKTAGTEAPAIVATGASAVTINGDLSAPNCQAVNAYFGFVRLNGNLSGKPKKYPLLYTWMGGEIRIWGTAPDQMRFEGSVTVNGVWPGH